MIKYRRPTKSSLSSPAQEILEYLAKQPNAQDTIDGILNWWESDAHIRKRTKVAETVARLVEQGLLKHKRSAEGAVFYRMSARYFATLQRRQPRKR